MSNAFWLVTVPNEGRTPEKTFERLRAHTDGSSKGYLVQVPSLTVGTLDSLMALSDDMERIDMSIEQAVRKIERQYADVTPKDREPLLIDAVPVDRYLPSFVWEHAKRGPGATIESSADGRSLGPRPRRDGVDGRGRGARASPSRRDRDAAATSGASSSRRRRDPVRSAQVPAPPRSPRARRVAAAGRGPGRGRAQAPGRDVRPAERRFPRRMARSFERTTRAFSTPRKSSNTVVVAPSSVGAGTRTRRRSSRR